jgi:glycosyltransferase involved in cell wall biosynthesis
MATVPRWKYLPLRAIQVIHDDGYKAFVKKSAEALRDLVAPPTYARWISKYDRVTRCAHQMRTEMSGWPFKPLISVIMPVYNTDSRWLAAAIRSVQAQLYTNWELCISDDASTRVGARDMLLDFAKQDTRIRTLFRTSNGNISINSNSALSLASGEFVALLDSDDALPQHALYWIAKEIIEHPDVDLIYSDEDKIDEKGKRFDPYFKPDWNPALMLSQNAFCHLGVYRRSLVEKVGGFRCGFEGRQDHDLVLRCARETSPQRIRHIPRILYHRRATGSSIAAKHGAKPHAWQAGRRAIEEHLARQGLRATVRRALLEQYQVEYELPVPLPRVSVLIPTTANPTLLEPCLASLLSCTTYGNFEVLLLVNEIERNEHGRAELLRHVAERSGIRVLLYSDRPFNYSWVNNWGAGQASGQVLCLLNDDTEIITPDWLQRLVARVVLPGVGAVGAMMYYPNETIQHAGVILGLGGVAGHAFHDEPRGKCGYFSRACLEQDLSCVTAGCLAIRRDLFLAQGGFDERFTIAYNDVDFCIRLRAAGWRILWTPTVELYHRESASVGRPKFSECRDERAVAMMRKQWGPVLDSDPYYNPNLSLRNAFGLAFPPRL